MLNNLQEKDRDIAFDNIIDTYKNVILCYGKIITQYSEWIGLIIDTLNTDDLDDSNKLKLIDQTISLMKDRTNDVLNIINSKENKGDE